VAPAEPVRRPRLPAAEAACASARTAVAPNGQPPLGDLTAALELPK